ncbi:MAG: helix-turn-helix domain-containing protein [Thermodesulfobacteriota bacterium]
MKGKNVVGDNIRRLRLKTGFTQEELALRSGLSQSYINQLESGKRRFTQKSLELIADAFSVAIAELLKEDTPHNVPMVEEKGKRYGYNKKRPNKKEFWALLNELPDHIVEHYFILLKMEKEVWKKEKRL